MLARDEVTAVSVREPRDGVGVAWPAWLAADTVARIEGAGVPEPWAHQVEFADVILVSKIDLISGAEREELLALPPAEVVHRLFHEEAPQLVGDKPLRFACSCSRERVEGMLVSLGREEADAAVDAGGGTASVLCEFCGQGYTFDAPQIATLFAQEASAQPAAPRLQ